MHNQQMGLRTFNALQLNKVIIEIVIVRKKRVSRAHTLSGYIYTGTNLATCVSTHSTKGGISTNVDMCKIHTPQKPSNLKGGASIC